jgi:para-aminobenzoate synthetase component 2
VISGYAGRIPIFGVCLGHQAIGAAYGATVTQAPELCHGKTSEVHHSGTGVLAGLPDPFTATRYHSLAVVEATLPDEIEVTGRTRTGTVMALRHRTLPVEGVQFHPEAVLTQGGHLLLANWLAMCGYPEALDRVATLAADVEARRLAAFT